MRNKVIAELIDNYGWRENFFKNLASAFVDLMIQYPDCVSTLAGHYKPSCSDNQYKTLYSYMKGISAYRCNVDEPSEYPPSETPYLEIPPSEDPPINISPSEAPTGKWPSKLSRAAIESQPLKYRHFGAKLTKSLEKAQILVSKKSIIQKFGPRDNLGWPWLL
jgi:hypothetical protein